MFKTRRKSYFSSKSSYRPYGKRRQSLNRWQILALIPLTLLGLELLLRLGVRLTGQTEALAQPGGEQAEVADYRLKYVDPSGTTYDSIARQGSLVVRRSPLLGYELLPAQSGDRWSINPQGFRGRPVSLDKPANEMRIVVLGGSAAFGQLSSSDKAAFPQALETKLKWRVNKQQTEPSSFRPQQLPYYADEQAIALSKPKRIEEKQYRVINAAVPGYISSNELSRFVHDVLAYEPDMIVALNGYTDLLIPSDRTAADIPNLDTALEDSWAHFSQSIRSRVSQFFNGFYIVKVPSRWLIRSQEKPSLELPPNLSGKLAEIPKEKELQRRVERYERNLSDLARLSETAQIPLIVALQPEIGDRATPTEAEAAILKRLGKQYPKQIDTAYGQLRQAVQRAQQAHPNILSLNLEDLYSNTKTDVFQDPIHLTDEANQILAEKLYGAIAARLEVEAAPYQGALAQ